MAGSRFLCKTTPTTSTATQSHRHLSHIVPPRDSQGRRRASTVPGQVSEDLDSVIWAYNGVSKKGYAPYNHRKKNQDVYIAEKDPVTDSLYLCVMDGHGEVGDKVTAQLKKQIPGRLFAHPDWATDCNKALAEVRPLNAAVVPTPTPLHCQHQHQRGIRGDHGHHLEPRELRPPAGDRRGRD